MDSTYIDGIKLHNEFKAEVLGVKFNLCFYSTRGGSPVSEWVFYRYLHLWLDAGRPKDEVFHVSPFMRVEVVE